MNLMFILKFLMKTINKSNGNKAYESVYQRSYIRSGADSSLQRNKHRKQIFNRLIQNPSQIHSVSSIFQYFYLTFFLLFSSFKNPHNPIIIYNKFCSLFTVFLIDKFAFINF